jgi:hypothetical protein
MAMRADRPNTGVTNYERRENAAGITIIDGGMRTDIAGARSGIGMTTTTIATTTKQSNAELYK